MSLSIKPPKGGKFGLVVPKKKGGKKPAPKLKKKNIFGDDTDEPVLTAKEFHKEALRRDAQRVSAAKKAKMEHQKALEEDPTVFEYDSVYKAIDSQKDTSFKLKRGIKGKSRYIEGILKANKQRDMDWLHAQEVAQQKLREQEGEEFADKEKIVTAAYKRQLMEKKKWEEDEKQRELRDGDVSKKKDMGDFYRNFFTRSEATGAAQPERLQIHKDTPQVEDDEGDFNIQMSVKKSSPKPKKKKIRSASGSGSGSGSESSESTNTKAEKKQKEEAVEQKIAEKGLKIIGREKAEAGGLFVPKKRLLKEVEEEVKQKRLEREAQEAEEARKKELERQKRLSQRKRPREEGDEPAAKKQKTEGDTDKAMSARERYLARKEEAAESSKEERKLSAKERYLARKAAK